MSIFSKDNDINNMDYRLSQYVTSVRCDTGLIMYNSLNSKMIYVSEEEDIIKIEEGDIEDLKIREKLISYGFLIKKSEQEAALLSYFDKIANKDLTLIILPTLQCNFRCSYCYEEFKNERITDATVDGIVEFIRKNISSFSRLHVDWFGGEPLLEIDRINEISQKLIQVCRYYKKPYIASMTTNGYLLTEEVFKEMLRNRIVSFQITIDGDKRNHDKNRHLVDGGSTYDTILNNLKRIKQNVRKHFSIIIRTNFTLSMCEHTEQHIEFMNRYFGDDRRFSFLFRPVGDWGGDRVKKMKTEIIPDCSVIFKKMSCSSKQLNYEVYYGILRNSICEAAKRNSYVIKPHGEVCKCTCLLDSKHNEVGRLYSDGKMKIDKERLGKWINNFDIASKECFSCSMLPSCSNSVCPANRITSKQTRTCGYENFYVKEVLKLFGNNIERYNFIEVV